MRIRRTTYTFTWLPRRSFVWRATGKPYTYFWLWWIFKPDPEPILTRLQNSRWLRRMLDKCRRPA